MQIREMARAGGRRVRVGGDRRGMRAPSGAGWLAGLVLSLVIGGAAPSIADDYDARDAGHPVRIVAYVLHPVGVALDYLLLRPAHWIVTHEPFKTLFGHED